MNKGKTKVRNNGQLSQLNMQNAVFSFKNGRNEEGDFFKRDYLTFKKIILYRHCEARSSATRQSLHQNITTEVVAIATSGTPRNDDTE